LAARGEPNSVPKYGMPSVGEVHHLVRSSLAIASGSLGPPRIAVTPSLTLVAS